MPLTVRPHPSPDPYTSDIFKYRSNSEFTHLTKVGFHSKAYLHSSKRQPCILTTKCAGSRHRASAED